MSADGQFQKNIADELKSSVTAVWKIKSDAAKKVGAKNHVHAIAILIRQGIIN